MQVAAALTLAGLASACADIALEHGRLFSGALFGVATVCCCLQVIVWLGDWSRR
jgi:hypothetical protein